MPGPDEAAVPAFDPIDNTGVRTNRVGGCTDAGRDSPPTWHGRPVASRDRPKEWDAADTLPTRGQIPPPDPPTLYLDELRRVAADAHPHGRYASREAGTSERVPVEVHLFRPGEDRPFVTLRAFGVHSQNWLKEVTDEKTGLVRKAEQPALFVIAVDYPDPQPDLPTRGQSATDHARQEGRTTPPAGPEGPPPV